MSIGLFGSDSSVDFADVMLAINAVTLVILVVGIFSDEIAGTCAKALKHALSTLLVLKARLGPRHK